MPPLRRGFLIGQPRASSHRTDRPLSGPPAGCPAQPPKLLLSGRVRLHRCLSALRLWMNSRHDGFTGSEELWAHASRLVHALPVSRPEFHGATLCRVRASTSSRTPALPFRAFSQGLPARPKARAAGTGSDHACTRRGPAPSLSPASVPAAGGRRCSETTPRRSAVPSP